MQLRTKGVFLGSRTVPVKEDGKEVSRELGEFYQPKSKDNRNIPVILPTGAKLTPYKEYEIKGELRFWAFGGNANYRVTAFEVTEVKAA